MNHFLCISGRIRLNLNLKIPIKSYFYYFLLLTQSLTWCGVRYETYSLLICILLGFLLGLPIMPWISQYYDGHQFQFPTGEMLSRGDLRSLWVGVLIAVPSGAGVALSVLGGTTKWYTLIGPDPSRHFAQIV